MIFIIIIIILIVIALSYYLYKILKEETTLIKEDKEKEMKKAEKNRVISYMELIEKDDIDTVLKNIKENKVEIERFRTEMQSEVRNASRVGDTEKARLCNTYLKKIDEII